MNIVVAVHGFSSLSAPVTKSRLCLSSTATARADLSDGDRPGDVNETDKRRSSLGGSVRQQANEHHHHGIAAAAADGGPDTDNAIPDGSCSRTDDDKHRQTDREITVEADSTDAKMHLNEEKERSNLNASAINKSAQAARLSLIHI